MPAAWVPLGPRAGSVAPGTQGWTTGRHSSSLFFSLLSDDLPERGEERSACHPPDRAKQRVKGEGWISESLTFPYAPIAVGARHAGRLVPRLQPGFSRGFPGGFRLLDFAPGHDTIAGMEGVHLADPRAETQDQAWEIPVPRAPEPSDSSPNDAPTIGEHPMFPIELGQPVEARPREIAFIQVRRRRLDDEGEDFVPGDIPAADLHSWDEVYDRYGGGQYKAVAKDAKHRIIRTYPPQGYVSFQGESNVLVPYNAAKRGQVRAGAVPAPSAAPAAPSEMERLMETFLKRMEKLEEKMEAQKAAPASDTSVLVAMMNNNTQLAIENAKATAAAAAAAAEANSRMLVGIIGAIKPAPPQDVASLIAMIKALVPAQPPHQGLGEQVAAFKAISEVVKPDAGSNDPMAPMFDLVGKMITADAAKKADAPPAPSPRSEPQGEKRYIPGYGLVRLLVPEDEVRVAAPQLSAAAAPVVAEAPALPPQAVMPPAAVEAPAAQPVPQQPPAAASVPQQPPAAPVPQPPTAAVTPSAPDHPSSMGQQPSVDVPRAVSTSPLVEVTAADREEAFRKVLTLRSMPLDERRRLLAMVPGFGAQGDELAIILDKLPPEALRPLLQSMTSEHVGMLRYANGIIPS